MVNAVQTLERHQSRLNLLVAGTEAVLCVSQSDFASASLSMSLQLHSGLTCTPVRLSSCQPGRVHAPAQQFQRHTNARVRGKKCCTYAAQSMIDALGGKGQTPQRAWWNDQKELWAAVHTPQELDAELEGSGKELVVVDFYGTWCVGCAKVYPEICHVAADPVLRQKCHFVKVCVDSLKDRMKADGVRSLPYVAFYHPIEGKMLGYVNLPSRSRLLRSNIDKMLENSGAKFALDPNGFVIVTEAAQSRVLNTEEEMEVNLQEMQKEREELLSNVPVFSAMMNWMQKVTMSGEEQSR